MNHSSNHLEVVPVSNQGQGGKSFPVPLSPFLPPLPFWEVILLIDISHNDQSLLARKFASPESTVSRNCMVVYDNTFALQTGWFKS